VRTDQLQLRDAHRDRRAPIAPGRHLPAIRESRHDEVVVVMSPIEELILLKRLVAPAWSLT
jgi:hypothetical protein